MTHIEAMSQAITNIARKDARRGNGEARVYLMEKMSAEEKFDAMDSLAQERVIAAAKNAVADTLMQEDIDQPIHVLGELVRRTWVDAFNEAVDEHEGSVEA